MQAAKALPRVLPGDLKVQAGMAEQGAWAIVKPMPHRKRVLAFSPFLYKYRNLIERFFGEIEHLRVVATRCDKDPANLLADFKARGLAGLATSYRVRDLARPQGWASH